MSKRVDVKTKYKVNFKFGTICRTTLSRCTNSECRISDSIEISLQWHCRWLAWNGRNPVQIVCVTEKPILEHQSPLGLNLYFLLLRREFLLVVKFDCLLTVHAISLFLSLFFPFCLCLSLHQQYCVDQAIIQPF